MQAHNNTLNSELIYELSNELYYSVKNNNYKNAKKALIAGANPNAQLTNQTSILHIAVQHNNIEIAELLLLNGAAQNHLDKESNSPLHLAAKKKNPAMIQLLLEFGAKPELKNSSKQTAFDILRGLYFSEKCRTVLLNYLEEKHDPSKVYLDKAKKIVIKPIDNYLYWNSSAGAKNYKDLCQNQQSLKALIESVISKISSSYSSSYSWSDSYIKELHLEESLVYLKQLKELEEKNFPTPKIKSEPEATIKDRVASTTNIQKTLAIQPSAPPESQAESVELEQVLASSKLDKETFEEPGLFPDLNGEKEFSGDEETNAREEGQTSKIDNFKL